jgi:RNA polymerase sigma factor (sigma-70 family)
MKNTVNFMCAGSGASNDLFGAHLYKLVNKNIRSLSRKFMSILSEQDVDDLVHEAWLHVYEQKGSFKVGGNFAGWVYKTCRNFLWKQTPKISKGLNVTLYYDDPENDDTFGLDSDYSSEFADGTWAPDTLLISRESEQHIWDTIGRLNASDQKLAGMMIDGKSRERMASEMDCTDGTLRVRVLRLRAKLKSYAIGA